MRSENNASNCKNTSYGGAPGTPRQPATLSSPMNSRFVLSTLHRMCLVVAIAACATIVAESAGMTAGLCGNVNDCARVRSSEFSQVGPFKLELIGFGAFAVLMGLSVSVRSPRWRRLVFVGTALAGLGGAALIFIQAAVLQVYCRSCLVVDASAVVAGIAALALLRLDSGTQAPALSQDPGRLAWWLTALLAVCLPILWAQFGPEPVAPDSVRALAKGESKAIVAFGDFECPHCKLMHKLLRSEIEQRKLNLPVVWPVVALKFHKGARTASRVYACLGRDVQEKTLDEYFEATTALTTEGEAVALAVARGANEAEIRSCLQSGEGDRRAEVTEQIYRDLHAAGLPLTYVGGRAILGNDPPKLRDALDRLLRPAPALALPMPIMFLVLGGAALLAAFMSRPGAGPLADNTGAGGPRDRSSRRGSWRSARD